MNIDPTNLHSSLSGALKSFGDDIADCRADNAVLPWPPMLPYVHPAHWKSSPRFFYIGRDTYGWNLGGGGFSDFFTFHDGGDFEGYLKANASVLPFEMRATAWNGCTGSFWQVANLLHLRLRLGRIADTGNLAPEESLTYFSSSVTAE